MLFRTRDLCDTGAVFYHLSYQANWELVTTGVIQCEFVIYPWMVKNVSEYMKDHIFELRRKI